MKSSHKKLLGIGVGLVALYVIMKQKAPAPAAAGLGSYDQNGRVGSLKRPVGSRLASRLGTVTDTRDLGGLGDFGADPTAPDASVLEGFSALGLIEQTRMRGAVAAAGEKGALIAGTIPNDPGRDATSVPWWEDGAILNASTPADPYNLQPVNTCGDPVNPLCKTPGHTDKAGIVKVDGHGMVNEVAEVVPYIEPGDPSYGDMTETDFGDEDASTYDPNPGHMIGLRQN